MGMEESADQLEQLRQAAQDQLEFDELEEIAHNDLTRLGDLDRPDHGFRKRTLLVQGADQSPDRGPT